MCHEWYSPSPFGHDAGNSGSDSQFASILSTGGGFGGGADTELTGGSGGSGGGSAIAVVPEGQGNTPFRSPSQGNNGAVGTNNASAGGGGAGAAGGTGGGGTGGAGGAGKASSITGSPLTYAGGGGGGGQFNNNSGGPGGSSIGGRGGDYSTGSGVTAGTTNTGSGGGAMGSLNGSPVVASGAGGSGVVVIKIPNTKSATFTAGVTANGNTGGSITPDTSVAGYNIYVVTATSNTSQTVTFS
jgi:hypothetical protein